MSDRRGFFVGHAVSGFPGGGLTPVVTTANLTATSNTNVRANSASQLTITLPPSPIVGDIVQVTGAGTGGWVLSKNTGQNIYDSKLGGTTAYSTLTGATKTSVQVRYVATNKWVVINARGTLAIA